MSDRPDTRFPHHNTPTPIAGVVMLVGISLFVGSLVVVFLIEFGTGASTVAPIAAVDFQFDANATGLDDFGRARGTNDGMLTMTVTHGDPVDAGRLFVSGAGGTPARSWALSSRYAPDSEVSAGSSLSVWATRGETVALVWVAADGDRSAVIDVWNGPAS